MIDIDYSDIDELSSREVRARHTIDIIEFQYTYDLQLHTKIPTAIAQHAQLQTNLRDGGWKAVFIHPFIIGSAGTIGMNCHDTLTTCGVTSTDSSNNLLIKDEPAQHLTE